MKEYKLLSKLECGGGTCPAVVQNGNDYLIIGNLLSPEETQKLLSNANVGIDSATGEIAIKVPANVMQEAFEKMATTTNA